MKILLVSYSNRKTDGRLIELIKVCKMIGDTFVVSQSDKKEDCGQSDLIYIGHKRFNYLRFILFCLKKAKFFGKVDLVFADNRAAIIPVMICKTLLHIRHTVYDARELYVINEVHHIRGKIGCIIERLFIRKFSLITCANSFRADIMQGLYKLKDKPLVYENIRCLEGDESGKICIDIDKEKVNIISTSGCLLERKSDVLARAVCELGEKYRLFLVGSPDVKGIKEIEKIKTFSKADNIVIIDHLSKAELKALIRKCDIGIVSYDNDSTNSKYCASGKLYEYLFEGIPVVTTSNPPLKAMCENYGFGISDDAFIDGIRAVSEDIAFYRKNVNEFIKGIDIDENNKTLAKTISYKLGIKTVFKQIESNEKCYERFLFVTGGYPTEGKQLYTFLDALICEIADLGKVCTVVYPVSLTHFFLQKEKLPPKDWTRTTQDESKIRVLCPRIITFSNGKFLHGFRSLWNYCAFRRKVLQTIKSEKLSFDVVYGHFLQPSGFIASELGEQFKVPSCVAYGENTTYNVEVFGLEKSRELIKDITACISVSSENTRFLIENNVVPKERIATIPNAINRSLFYPRDKEMMRAKYNIPHDSFVVAFVGYFTEIKGSLRLSEALDKTDDVYSLFIGSGALKPSCKNTVFVGSVPHDKIPELLSAADIFALPTIAEGCCNAIIEALSCGLPVISSSLPFNDDVLNDECSIRIDTSNTDEIASAIKKLRDDCTLRLKMSEEAINTAKNFDIKVRAERIIEWIRHCDLSRNETATEADL